MKKKSVYYFFLVTLLLSVPVIAQDFKEDFKQVQKAYDNLDKFSCEVQVKMYQSPLSEKPGETMYSSIKKQKNNFFYSMGTMKMIVNEKCILYIDEKEKQLVYTIRDTKRELKIPNQDAAALIDSLVKKSDSVVFISTKQNSRDYCIYSAKGLIKKIQISIDKESSLIKTITYYYDPAKTRASNKVIIEYQHINTSPAFADAEFSEKKYVAYSNNVLKAFPPYTHYSTSIIDQREFK